jgi:hypothetical protein
MRITWAAGTRTFASVAVAALVAAGAAACGAAAASPAASPAKTAAASAPASQAPAANASASASSAGKTSAKADASTTGKLPGYRPATVVSDSGTTTVLKSPDSVTKIGAFYRNALANGGWDTTASSMGSFHASFTAHRAHEGVSISVYPRFGGAGISISRYPV